MSWPIYLRCPEGHSPNSRASLWLVTTEKDIRDDAYNRHGGTDRQTI